jgi:hypothetical protein
MNGRIFHEPTPAKRAAALAFSVFLAKWKEFQQRQESLTGAPRLSAADSYVEEFLDYADLASYLDILLRRELAQAALDEHTAMEAVLDPIYRERNRERKDELRLQIAQATLELEDLKL